MEQHNRKQNRLPEYDYSQEGAYFITICTRERKRILSQISVGTGVLDCPQIQLLRHGEIAEKYIRQMDDFYGHLSVDKYAIMPDHIHMIIRLPYGSMWASTPTNDYVGADAHIRPKYKVASIVRSIKVLTTKEIGKPIFQRSYYDHVIRNQQDYNEIWQYIENNPKKWSMGGKDGQC